MKPINIRDVSSKIVASNTPKLQQTIKSLADFDSARFEMWNAKALMQICGLSLFDQILAENSPEESASHHVRRRKGLRGPRGEVQWVSGSSWAFEIGSG